MNLLGRLCGTVPPVRYKHSYSIAPRNFLVLPEEKQRRRLYEFYDLLRMLQGEALITMTRSPVRVQYGTKDEMMEVLQVLLDSEDPLDDVLERLGFSFTIDDLHPPVAVRSEGMRDFCTYAGEQVVRGRAYAVYGTPSVLPPAWIHAVFSTFHRVQVRVRPLRPDDALRKLRSRDLLYSGVRTRRADIQKKLEDIRTLTRSLELGDAYVFVFTINGFVFSRTARDLAALHREVRRNAAALNLRITTSYAQQRNLVNGGGASWLAGIGSMGMLYPFASSEMIEVPNGIALGRNLDTRSPVIYDIDQRKNHNVFTAGTTGSGKSFANKIILKRFLEKRPNTMCMVIDPQGEYLPHAGYFGLDGLEVEPGRRYGLDPFALFESPLEAADIVGAATGAPVQARKEWRGMADRFHSVREMYEASSEGAGRYLADLVEGGVAEILRGKPSFSDRMIISLKKTDGQEYEGLFILLVLAYAWKRVNALPPKQWKFILLDEAWRMGRMRQSVAKIGEMARQGRKKSMIFAISTQQFSDMDRALDDDSRLTELFDTKIILQMSQSAARATGTALGLTDAEVERIANFRAGSGLIQTSDNSIYSKLD